jgi:predicted transcriptional regulator YdeE
MVSASFRYVLPLFLSLSLPGFAQISATPAPTAPATAPTVKVGQQDGFTVVGLTVRTTSDKEAGGQGLIPQLWESVMDQDKLSQVPNRLSDDLVVVYSDYASDATGAYSYTLGVRVSSADKVPDGFVVRKIQAGKYAVIQSEQGPPQEVIPGLWAKINQMTPQQLGGERAYQADFETYPDIADWGNIQMTAHIGLK